MTTKIPNRAGEAAASFGPSGIVVNFLTTILVPPGYPQGPLGDHFGLPGGPLGSFLASQGRS